MINQHRNPFNDTFSRMFEVLKNHTNDFYNAMEEIDFTVADEEEKKGVLEVLDNTIKKMKKRRKQIRKGEI